MDVLSPPAVYGTRDVSVIIPVLNEWNNIPPLIAELREQLRDLAWEVLFVDDGSVDGTADLCRRYAAEDDHIRFIQRSARTGLASACFEGMLSASAQWLVVMDGDLQHDPSIIPAMLSAANSGRYDLVAGIRATWDRKSAGMPLHRIWLSRTGRFIGTAITGCPPLSDPLSGFFAVNRDFLDEVRHDLSLCGFKLMLDMIASCRRPVVVGEIPYRFRPRRHGTSKLDTTALLEFARLLLLKRYGLRSTGA